MRRVPEPPRPRGWQTHVLAAGRRWLNHPKTNREAKRPKDLWLRYRQEAGLAFGFICCYTAVRDESAEMDHFVPWASIKGKRRAYLAYEWSNFRWAAHWINKCKGTQDFPDPKVVQDDWFELELPSLELRSTAAVPPAHAQSVKNVLKYTARDFRVMAKRDEYFASYRRGDCSLGFLDRHAPLIARALRANPAYLLPKDRPATP